MTPSSSYVSPSLTSESNNNVKVSNNDHPVLMPVNRTHGIRATSPTLNSKWDCVQENEVLRVTDAGYTKLFSADEIHVSLKFSKPEKRMLSFSNDQSCLHIADAGFYKNGQGLECFCCPFKPRMEAFTDPLAPMRVHTRWSPHCPFVERQENEAVRRTVEQEVMSMEQDHDRTDINPWRRTTLDLNDVIEVIENGYDNCRIKEAVIRFFMRTGEYSNVENLRKEINEYDG